MTEPATTAVASTALAVGALTVTGSLFGMSFDLLMPGLFGGLVALSFADQVGRWRMAISVATSTILAAYFAPAAVVLAVDWLPVLAKMPAAELRALAACAIGLASQTLVPTGLALLKRRAGGVA
ncbi:MAG: hypothetical protein PGN26_14625 [Xylophilus ampelinus]